MAPLDLDKYVEIARLCKYLPENDLKVGAGGVGRGRTGGGRRYRYSPGAAGGGGGGGGATHCAPAAPVRLRVRPAAGGVQRAARLHARHRLRGHPRAGNGAAPGHASVLGAAARADVCPIPQFYDLCELFRTGGQVPDTNYIFMVRAGAASPSQLASGPDLCWVPAPAAAPCLPSPGCCTRGELRRVSRAAAVRSGSRERVLPGGLQASFGIRFLRAPRS